MLFFLLLLVDLAVVHLLHKLIAGPQVQPIKVTLVVAHLNTREVMEKVVVAVVLAKLAAMVSRELAVAKEEMAYSLQ